MTYAELVELIKARFPENSAANPTRAELQEVLLEILELVNTKADA